MTHENLPTTMLRNATLAIIKADVPAVGAHATSPEVETLARVALVAGLATIQQNDCSWWNSTTGAYEHISTLSTAIKHSEVIHQ